MDFETQEREQDWVCGTGTEQYLGDLWNFGIEERYRYERKAKTDSGFTVSSPK